MPVFLLTDEPVFPPADIAESDGLLAIGGDLSVQRLMTAYTHGIFPWFIEDGKVFWFSPDPRTVIFPEKFNPSKSLKRIWKSKKFEIRFDTAFRQVIENCSEVPRPGQEGTWISDEFIEAYTNLHRLGYAHSVETYYQGSLVGGLYGVSQGAAFFGESMFHLMPDASKIALLQLVERLKSLHFTMIDAQVETPLMLSLGAELISRKRYLDLLSNALKSPIIRAFP